MLGKLKPFFSYYGSKHRTISAYPNPQHRTIIEPFAGSAAYACKYYQHQIILCDVSPYVSAVWKYLIAATPDEIMSLPVDVHHANDLLHLPIGAQYLIRYWFNKAQVKPVNMRTPWQQTYIRAGSYWQPDVRERIAKQVNLIKHWIFLDGPHTNLDNTHIDNIQATWFVDPPYNNAAGIFYVSDPIDFPSLGNWCKTRGGQVIVCENFGADWLPFKLFGFQNGAAKITAEAIWTNDKDF